MPIEKALNVHVVDDSALVRQMLTSLLEKNGSIRVTSSPDPLVALAKIAKHRPDVLITDLEMPRMDGVSFVRAIVEKDPLPIIVCSANATPGARGAIDALCAGAVEIIAKPKIGIKEFLENQASSLIELVHQVARCKVNRKHAPPVSPRPRSAVAAKNIKRRAAEPGIIAIGASTGGTEALRYILAALGPDCPPVLVVQHMPEIFTRAFAHHLNRDFSMHVKEAEAGDRVLPGQVLIAPGDRHMRLRSAAGYLTVALDDAPPVSRHRPSIDVLFHSVATTVGKGATGILLTGMGKDGARGLLEIRNSGARTIAQDEASCVVFGMPREAIEIGAASEVLSLHEIFSDLSKIS